MQDKTFYPGVNPGFRESGGSEISLLYLDLYVLGDDALIS